ncbi:MAG: sulfatase-like hydrolase/transferase [Candidatus Hermodarchaeota archaeon]
MKIFLIIFDTLRKDHTGKTYGNNWIKTPNFDEFAKDSIVFDKAYPESLPTLPVRRAIHTGIRTFPFNHEKPKLRSDDLVDSPGWNPIPPNQTHISEYMKRNAYITTFITSTYHQFKPNMNFHLGFDEWHFIRGHEFDKYVAKMKGKKNEINQYIKNFIVKKNKENKNLLPVQKILLKNYFANIQERKKETDFLPAKTFLKATKTIENLKENNNVFLLIDEFDPHEPWHPPSRYLELYLDKNYKGNNIIMPLYAENLKFLSEEELQCMRANYAGEVSFCDTWFGYFIEKLKQMEIYNDALIILISDHGHSLGEHNVIGKVPRCLYPELVDIPLMIKPPGDFQGPKRINKSYVYNIDILPTIFGFLQKDIPEVFEGKDLSCFIEEKDHMLEGRDYITSGMAIWTLYKDDNYALITSNDKKEQKLFDLKKDPKWNNNIADDNQDIYNELYSKIENDAKGNLLLTYKSDRFDDFKDWYQVTYLV